MNTKYSGPYEISAFPPLYATTFYGQQAGQVLRKPVLPNFSLFIFRLAWYYYTLF